MLEIEISATDGIEYTMNQNELEEYEENCWVATLNNLKKYFVNG